MSAPAISEGERIKLLQIMARLDGTAEEPEGLDGLLFDAFEAWAILQGLEQTHTKLSGVVAKAIRDGNAYILVISLGKLLLEKAADHSLPRAWHRFGKHTSAERSERASIGGGA